MTKLPYALLRDLIDEIRREQQDFEMFMRGYVHGYQDCEADFVFEDRDHFEARMEELFNEQ